MSKDDNLDIAKKLYTATLEQLLARIKSGEATAAELNVALQACVRAGVNMQAKKGNALGQLAGELGGTLPFPIAGEKDEDGLLQ